MEIRIQLQQLKIALELLEKNHLVNTYDIEWELPEDLRFALTKNIALKCGFEEHQSKAGVWLVSPPPSSHRKAYGWDNISSYVLAEIWAVLREYSTSLQIITATLEVLDEVPS